MKNIIEIEKGSFITRVSPSDGYGDRSYIGDKLQFIGVANGMIYLKNLEESYIRMFREEKLIKVAFDIWQNGWDYYTEPESLFTNLYDKYTLELKLKKALENEDYEEAQRIRKLIE